MIFKLGVMWRVEATELEKHVTIIGKQVVID